MELRDYLALLRRWWWLVVVLALLAGGVAALLTPRQEPLYAATTTVLLSPGGETGLPDVSDVNQGARLSSTYGELMRTRSLMAQVIANLQLSMNPDVLLDRVSVSSVSTTNLLELTVLDESPQLAADLANEIVRVFILQNEEVQASRYAASRQNLEGEIAQLEADLNVTRSELVQAQIGTERLRDTIADYDDKEAEQGLTAIEAAERDQLLGQLAQDLVDQDELQSQLNQEETRYEALLASFEEVRLLEAATSDFMNVVEEAQPGVRTGTLPRPIVNGLQATLAGAVLALGAIVLLEYLRVTVKSVEEVERVTGVPSLGVVSDIRGDNPVDKLVTATQPRSPAAEAYRLLRTNINFTAGDGPIRSLVVSSSGPAEGKTTTAANLAAAVAQAGRRVILVDTDLRRPTLHKLFQQTNTRGVTTVLLQDGVTSVGDHVLSTSVDNLYLMPSGPLPPNPADLFGSQRMGELIQELGVHADVVVFDSPPVLAVADAILLGRLCDAMLMVVLADSTRADLLRKAQEQVSQAGINLLGTVLNRAAGEGSYYYYRY